jgi:cell division protein FtsQ
MAKRAPKKPVKLTQRQLQSQEAMRSKAARKKREAFMHTSVITLCIICGIGMIGGGGWAWYTGAIQRTYAGMIDGLYGYTVQKGYGLETLYVEGRKRTSMQEVQKAIAVTKGDPLLRLSLHDIRQRLEAIGTIKHAAVERQLPGTLSIRIIEREPVALWQHQGNITLIDDNGVAMTDLKSSDYPKLPLVVGSDAPQHVTALLTMLATQPELQALVEASVRVGQRRWNIRMKGGVEIMLPEEKPEEAWQKLAEIQKQQQLLAKDIEAIDLRLEGRLFIKLSPNGTPGGATGDVVSAKET